MRNKKEDHCSAVALFLCDLVFDFLSCQCQNNVERKFIEIQFNIMGRYSMFIGREKELALLQQCAKIVPVPLSFNTLQHVFTCCQNINNTT